MKNKFLLVLLMIMVGVMGTAKAGSLSMISQLDYITGEIDLSCQGGCGTEVTSESLSSQTTKYVKTISKFLS